MHNESTVSVLTKGLNFAVVPTRLPMEDIICGVETAIKKLPAHIAEEIRQDTSAVLRKTKLPKSNITPSERVALRDLRNNQDIVVLRADKGNATVILNTETYNRKIEELLIEPTYKLLKRNPTERFSNKTKELVKKSSIPENMHWMVLSKAPKTPTFYGLPKIHKDKIPLRPIVSTIGSPTYNLAKYLASKLQDDIGKTSSFVKDSYHFIDILKKEVVTSTDLLVSFDVESLFTNVPLEDTMLLIKERYPEDITELFRHCLTSSYFSFHNKIYEQQEGVAMGSPLSPVVANLFMENFEATALDTATLKPKCWYRYVDDTFVIWPHGRENLYTFLKHINSLHNSIKFTMEVEDKNKTIAFLDIKIIRNHDGNLGHRVHRKTTHTDRYLNANSHHHPSQKHGLIKTLVTRARRICEEKFLGQEITHLTDSLQRNGYSSKLIKKAFEPKRSTPEEETEDKIISCAYLPYLQNTTDRIAKILRKFNVRTIFGTSSKISMGLRSIKDKFPLESEGIYLLKCQGCSTSYVGQTSSNVSKRMARIADSAIAEHFVETGHTFSFNPKVLAKTKGQYARLVREAIEICKLPENINRDDGLRLKTAWLPILKRQSHQNSN